MALVLMSRGSSWRKYCGMKRWQNHKFLKGKPDYQVVVLAGQGHIVGYGIPSRVATTTQGKQLVQRSVLLSPLKMPQLEKTNR